MVGDRRGSWSFHFGPAASLLSRRPLATLHIDWLVVINGNIDDGECEAL